MPDDARAAHGPHATDDELQRIADGEDAQVPASVRAHVASCARCEADVAAVRRVTAMLCLTSAAPARPAEGARPRPEAMTPDDARVEALLGLTSDVPATLGARTMARRVAGDRVILPVPPATTPAGVAREGARGRRWRPAAGLAAAAVALAAALYALAGTGRPERSAPDMVAGRGTAPRTDEPSVVPRRPPDTVPGPRAVPRLPDAEVAFTGTGPAWTGRVVTRLVSRSLDGAALDSVVRAALGGSSHVVTIAPAEGAGELARQAALRIARGGVPRDRVRVLQGPRTAMQPVGSIEVTVLAREP